MALRESHDLVNPPAKGEKIWPLAKDNQPVFRNPFYVVPDIPINDEAFKAFLDSKPEDRPETLHEIMKQRFPSPPAAKQWAMPEEPMKKVKMKRRVERSKRMSQYRVVPWYPGDEDSSEKSESSQGESEVLSNASLSLDAEKPNEEAEEEEPEEAEEVKEIRKPRWLDGFYMPKTRHGRWPGIRVPKTTQRRPRSDFLQRLEKTRAEETYRHFFMMKEEHMKTQEELEQEREKMRKELEEEKERELAKARAMKIDRSPIKGALKNIVNIGEGDDVPIDIFELDKFCRLPLPDIDKLPAMMQQEERANRAFIDYLDQNGVSEMLIGTLFMIFSNPGPQENAKELLRLGLGGKPMETANVDDALQNIQDTKDRIAALEQEQHDLQVKLLKTLKDNELPDAPMDPNNFQYPKRRMDYLLKAFLCRTRPGDVAVGEVYDLPPELSKLAKYNVLVAGFESTGTASEGLRKDATTQQDYRPV